MSAYMNTPQGLDKTQWRDILNQDGSFNAVLAAAGQASVLVYSGALTATSAAKLALPPVDTGSFSRGVLLVSVTTTTETPILTIEPTLSDDGLTYYTQLGTDGNAVKLVEKAPAGAAATETWAIPITTLAHYLKLLAYVADGTPGVTVTVRLFLGV